MKINKGYIVAGLIIAFTLFFEIAAHADASNQATKLTFSETVQIPGQILPAGTYLLKMANPGNYHNLVQIFNADGTVLYATLQTISAERLKPADDTLITLAEAPGEPVTLLKWFYPGSLVGNEFVYSRDKEKELEQEKSQVIAVRQPATSNSGTNAVGN
jgi:Protein of unknown function (DUF2911)